MTAFVGDFTLTLRTEPELIGSGDNGGASPQIAGWDVLHRGCVRMKYIGVHTQGRRSPARPARQSGADRSMQAAARQSGAGRPLQVAAARAARQSGAGRPLQAAAARLTRAAAWRRCLAGGVEGGEAVRCRPSLAGGGG